MSSTDIADFNRTLIEEFRANDGKVTGVFAGAPMVLITHTGAKSGQQAALMPNFADYQEKTDRVIPVVALTRV